MKRIIIMAAVALGLSATAFAGNGGNANSYSINVNLENLGKYLALSSDQYEEVANITSFFSDKMQSASFAKDKTQKLREAVYGNFKLMKKTLTDEQYKKYVYLVNVTLRNKGLDSSLEGMPQE